MNIITGLCLTVLTLKNGNPCQSPETWQSIASVLNSLCSYMRASPKLCLVSLEEN